MLRPLAVLLLLACATAAAAQTAPAPPAVAAAWRADPSLASPSLKAAGAWVPDADASPTALDHRFAAAGLAASAGFVCDNDGHIPQTHDAGPLAGSEAGRLLGTTLRLGF